MKLAWGIAILFVLLALTDTASAQSCAVLTDTGYQPDADCDGVLDGIDNCPSVNNADQRDMNRNRIGDACDALITEIIVNPDNHLRQGEFAHVTVRVLNNRPEALSDLAITVRNRDLDMDAERTLPFIPPGETAAIDFWLKIPRCAETGSYTLNIDADFDGGSETKTERITVDTSDACDRPEGPLDNTIINVFDRVEVDQGENVIVPISITNLGDDQERYELSIQGVGSLGTWRLDPSPSLRLPAGQRETVMLYLDTESTASAGEHIIKLTITSARQQTAIPIAIYVRGQASAGQFAPPREAADPQFPLTTLLKALLIIVLLAIIIAAIIIARRRRKRGDDENVPRSPPPMIPPDKPRKAVAVEEAEKPKVETYY